MKYSFTAESELLEDLKPFSHTYDLARTIYDIRQEVFRPARKHGYPDPRISSLLETLGEGGYELIELLEDKFNRVLEDRDVMEYS